MNMNRRYIVTFGVGGSSQKGPLKEITTTLTLGEIIEQLMEQATGDYCGWNIEISNNLIETIKQNVDNRKLLEYLEYNY